MTDAQHSNHLRRCALVCAISLALLPTQWVVYCVGLQGHLCTMHAVFSASCGVNESACCTQTALVSDDGDVAGIEAIQCGAGVCQDSFVLKFAVHHQRGVLDTKAPPAIQGKFHATEIEFVAHHVANCRFSIPQSTSDLLLRSAVLRC